MSRISVYTRDVVDGSYPFGLAKAVHFSVEVSGGRTALNNDYAILFAKGEVTKDNTIVPLGIEDPKIYRMTDGAFGICGKRIFGSGESYGADGEKKWSWKTEDFIHFEETGLSETADPDGSKMGDSLEIEDSLAEAAVKFWNPEVPEDDSSVT